MGARQGVAGTDRPVTPTGATRPVRVASWPHWYGPNPYLALLYRALEPHGVEHVRDVPLDPGAFAGPDGAADVLHLHWAYPLWRESARRGTSRSRRIRDALERLERIRAHGVALVWTVHNVVPHDGLRRGEAEAYAWLHELADLRVFHTESARAEATARYGRGRGDTILQHHGNWDGATPVPLPRAAVLIREELPDEPRMLLCFGQVRAYKGFDLAVETARTLDPEAYHLVVAGRAIDGEGRRLSRLARGARNVTRILEEIDDQRLADLLGAADAVLLPYRSVTGSGALLHALTVGRGVIATDLPFFREILGQEPDAGVLVPDAGPEALAAGVREFFAVETGSRGRAARRLADRFAWPDVVRPLAAWLRQEGRRRTRPQNPGGEEAGLGRTA